MKQLSRKDLLELDVLTVTGKTLSANLASADEGDGDIVRTIDNPYDKSGGLVALFW